ncbi:hypothetical protein [Nostoc flagelliforme]|nr:hypothetical protein [Nostoc flagelliforme]
MAREYRLKNPLLDVQDNYDFILIDCPFLWGYSVSSA